MRRLLASLVCLALAPSLAAAQQPSIVATVVGPEENAEFGDAVLIVEGNLLAVARYPGLGSARWLRWVIDTATTGFSSDLTEMTPFTRGEGPVPRSTYGTDSAILVGSNDFLVTTAASATTWNPSRCSGGAPCMHASGGATAILRRGAGFRFYFGNNSGLFRMDAPMGSPEWSRPSTWVYFMPVTSPVIVETPSCVLFVASEGLLCLDETDTAELVRAQIHEFDANDDSIFAVDSGGNLQVGTIVDTEWAFEGMGIADVRAVVVGDRRAAVATDGKEVILLDRPGGVWRTERLWELPENPATSLALSEDEEMLAVGMPVENGAGSVVVYDLGAVVEPPGDAGPGADAGPNVDGGVDAAAVDAGPRSDAGPGGDAGPGRDAASDVQTPDAPSTGRVARQELSCTCRAAGAGTGGGFVAALFILGVALRRRNR